MELKDKIQSLLRNQQPGVLATIRDNKPHICFMMFFHEGLDIYVATDRQSKKLEDIQNNPNVHVLLGNENSSWEESFLEIEGTASVEEDPALKSKFWNNSLKRWLLGPEDPNYVLLKVTPKHIYHIDKAGTIKPEVLTL
ncbi:pyridoxamine 5'-phosphate oxidase family protein [Ectobacillus ponti]|uniref:Pyridoxamine 5'-phosphate oxidase family protein n=1 Tax=Ectobacillus ponti TaxID=2961894 RepID=A0AA41XBM4_9BACI|nr:pyridoxamine 5'-phosphate oxidase family protein [Ectobacillus ponti]MCP8969908.1 pyridoxamine 5'-phosphate oxidase family protein [Ectobacillus ponti]